jgi:predicted protein tyrosine phosphatase
MILLLFLFVVGGRLVTEEECEKIRFRAQHWLPHAGSAYNDADYIGDGIFLGNVCAAHNVSWLRENRITRVMNMAIEWHNVSTEVETASEFVIDDETAMDEAKTRAQIVAAAAQLWKWVVRGERVLVHCNMGISRSTSVVLRYYQNEYGFTYQHWLDFIHSKRPCVRPNALFARILSAYDAGSREL